MSNLPDCVRQMKCPCGWTSRPQSNGNHEKVDIEYAKHREKCAG